MKYLLSIAVLFMIARHALAQERIMDEDQARSVFEEVEERRATIQTETAQMEMVIIDSREHRPKNGNYVEQPHYQCRYSRMAIYRTRFEAGVIAVLVVLTPHKIISGLSPIDLPEII